MGRVRTRHGALVAAVLQTVATVAVSIAISAIVPPRPAEASTFAGSSHLGMAFDQRKGHVLTINKLEGLVRVLDTAGREVARIPIKQPKAIALDRTRGLGYVASEENSACPCSLSQINTDDPSRAPWTIPLDQTPYAVGVEPRGQRVFVVTPSNVLVYDAYSMELIGRIPNDRFNGSLAIDPGNFRLYLPEADPRSIAVYDTMTLQRVRTITLRSSVFRVTDLKLDRTDTSVSTYLYVGASVRTDYEMNVPCFFTGVFTCDAVLRVELSTGKVDRAAALDTPSAPGWGPQLAYNEVAGRIYTFQPGGPNIQVMKADLSRTDVGGFGAIFPSGGVVDPKTGRVFASTGLGLSIYDGATGRPIAYPVGYAGSGPAGVAVDPTIGRVYTAGGGAFVSMLDSATGAVLATRFLAPLLSLEPRGVAVDPVTHRVYITLYGTGQVAVLNGLTLEQVAGITVGTNPTGVTVDPAGKRAYVTNEGSRSVSVIDTERNVVLKSYGFSWTPRAITFGFGYAFFVGSGDGRNRIGILNARGDIGAWDLESEPTGIALSTTVSRIYVIHHDTHRMSVMRWDAGTASIADLTSYDLGALGFHLARYPRAVAADPDGSRLYVVAEQHHWIAGGEWISQPGLYGSLTSCLCNYNGLGRITLGRDPSAIAVAHGGPVYVTDRPTNGLSVVRDPFARSSLRATAGTAPAFDAEFATESPFATVRPGDTVRLAAVFMNTGRTPWVKGTDTAVQLAVCLVDKTTCDAPSPHSAWGVGWVSSRVYAEQDQDVVDPGQAASFQFEIRVPADAASGSYRFGGDLILASTRAAIHPVGFYEDVVVAPGN